MDNAIVILKKGQGRILKSGGMWVFDNEIDTITGHVEDGDIVIVRDFDGYPMGKGFINRKSKIAVRLLSRRIDAQIDRDFMMKRVRNAWEYRKKVIDKIGRASCRERV